MFLWTALVPLLLVTLSSQTNLYTRYIKSDLILKTTEVSSISSCYFECWDIGFKCCAVGFLASQINRRRKTSATCYWIKCNQDMNGEGDIELEVFETPTYIPPEKLPKTGNASQSSIINNGIASNAVDGNYNSNFGAHSCTHTAPILPTHFEYVLPYEFVAESVELYNRMDCCSYRLSNVDVYIINDSGLTLCDKTGDMTNIANTRVYCEESIKGTGIRVLNPRYALIICEIDIYGRKLSP